MQFAEGVLSLLILFITQDLISLYSVIIYFSIVFLLLFFLAN